MATTPDIGYRVYPPLESPGNFWINNNGVNTLKGVPDDPDNLPRLPDEDIIYAFSRTEQAHTDYLKIRPALLPEEQDRIDQLQAENPYLVQVPSGVRGGDAEQRRFNNLPVYFAGRFRGAGFTKRRIKNTGPPTTEG